LTLDTYESYTLKPFSLASYTGLPSTLHLTRYAPNPKPSTRIPASLIPKP